MAIPSFYSLMEKKSYLPVYHNDHRDEGAFQSWSMKHEEYLQLVICCLFVCFGLYPRSNVIPCLRTFITFQRFW